jgi:hypothetical protein
MRPALLVLALACAACAAGAASPRMTLDAEVAWSEDGDDFGGFSGLALAPDGRGFTVVSDRGAWKKGALERDAEGRLTGVALGANGRLRAISGDPLEALDNDAEALAVDADGAAWISFEHFHRIRRYPDLAGPAERVPSHPAFARLQENSGLEALALDADGTLYAIPERSGRLQRPFPVYRYRYRDGDWLDPLALRRDGAFLVSDATFGPDGRLYVLERDFEWLGGFRTRVRRFDLGPAGFGAETTLLETRFGELDNMEGIGVWKDPEGRTRVLLLSDDNFFPLQRTMFAEYIVTAD